MPQVTRTDLAEEDIADILSDLARYSRRAAERLRDQIDRECRLLARFPRLGTERTDILAGLYSRPVAGRVVVYYRITDDGIEVQRVLHGARDVDASMFPG
jgi:toxin ParE1/3/4